ncbi:MAG: LysR family transcriptional regulator [Alphaproteobacteria bacterium]|nr:LysR family transcriptional regulator [Alphaproteobacteria bacterium]
MRDLPFLNGVRAFEAAARHGGFAKAAEELHVTAPAISRMVKLLEERMGVPLFHRRANGLALTLAGERYSTGLGPILDALAALTAEVTAEAGPPTLTVGVGPTFAIRWLIPRLADFRAEHPEIDVHITTGGITAPFSDKWTCGISLGDGVWPGLMAEPLVAADLLPVCAPALAERLKSPSDLAAESLIRVQHAPEDWPRWLAAAQAAAPSVYGPEVGYYGQAIQAALDGVGVAMGIRPYVDDDLAAGRLVAPFPLSIPKGSQWYLVHRPNRLEEPSFKVFRDWITSRAHGLAKPGKLS